MSGSLSVALKEWAAVCRGLENGRQIVLLRKGGIYESAGEFEVEHREFLLFPTYLHQKKEMLKLEAHGWLEARTEEPKEIVLSCAAVVSDIVQLKSRQQMERIEDEHIWAKPLIDMRFSYRPENPLYLLLVRTYRLAEPLRIANTPAYAGCKSWVPLGREIAVADALPVIEEGQYQIRRKSIVDRLRM